MLGPHIFCLQSIQNAEKLTSMWDPVSFEYNQSKTLKMKKVESHMVGPRIF